MLLYLLLGIFFSRSLSLLAPDPKCTIHERYNTHHLMTAMTIARTHKPLLLVLDSNHQQNIEELTLDPKTIGAFTVRSVAQLIREPRCQKPSQAAWSPRSGGHWIGLGARLGVARMWGLSSPWGTRHSETWSRLGFLDPSCFLWLWFPIILKDSL